MIRPDSKENAARTALVISGDFLLAWAALVVAVHIRRNVPLFFTRDLLPVEKLSVDLASVILFAGSFVVALALSGFYRRRVSLRERPLILMALVIQVALITTGGVFSEQLLPRTVLLGVLAIEMIALPAWRSLLRIALPIRPRETILVGSPAQVQLALAGLASAHDRRICAIGWAGPSGDPSDPKPLDPPYLGSLESTAVVQRLREAMEVICVSPNTTSQERLEMLRIRGPRGYLLLVSHADALLTSARVGWIGDQPMIEVAVRCGYGVRAAAKRFLDAWIASLLIILAAPIAIVVAAAIRLDDRGPVLIRQLRVGRGGVPFGMWKFRSMHVPKEGQTDGEGVTRVGAILRRYRLDEIPQLINVVAGDMSLVGPRPERPEIVARIVREFPEFELRSLVRPGLAGLAQVSGEYDSRPEVKLRYDLMYMCGWSLLLDLRLLLASVSASLSGSGR